MPHWTSAIVDVLVSHSGDLKRLAEIGGADYRTVYRGQSLQGCDLSGQDLKNVDLDGCEVEKARINDATQLDPRFDPRLADEFRYLNVRIPSEINRIVSVYAHDAAYVYKAWAYRSLVEKFVNQYRFGRISPIIQKIESNEQLYKLVAKSYRGRIVRRKIFTEGWKRPLIEKASIEFPEYNIAALAILSGAIFMKAFQPATDQTFASESEEIWLRKA